MNGNVDHIPIGLNKRCLLPGRVLQLMNLTDSRLNQGGCEKLELATISFFEQFRKIYVGDQVSPDCARSH